MVTLTLRTLRMFAGEEGREAERGCGGSDERRGFVMMRRRRRSSSARWGDVVGELSLFGSWKPYK